MGVEGVEFVLGLKNQVSGPASQAKASLAQLKGQLQGVDQKMRDLQRLNALYKASGSAFNDQVKKNEGEMKKLREQSGLLRGGISQLTPTVNEQVKAEKDFAKASKEAADEAGGELTAALEVGGIAFAAIGAAAAWAAKKLAEWTLEGAKLAIEAGAVKESLTAAYDLFGGGKGKDIFEKIDALGTALHVPTQKAHEFAKELIAEGVKGPNRLEQAVKSVITLQKVGGDDAANKLKGVIGEAAKSKQTAWWLGGRGVFTVTREQLVGTGVTIDEVYGALAKRLKKSNADVRMLMMQGQITADQGIDALNDAIERGKIGDTARKMTGDLTQVFTELKDNIGKILRDVDYKGFIKEVRGFAQLFNPATKSGATMKTVLVGAFNAIFKVAKEAVRGVKIATLELAIASLKILIALAPEIREFKKLSAEMGRNKAISFLLKSVWQGVKIAIFGVVIPLKMLTHSTLGAMRAFQIMTKPLEPIISALQKFGRFIKAEGGWQKAGAELIRGLVDGIKSGASAFVKTISSIGDAGVRALKKSWGISSPSKEAIEMRKQIDAGFEKGDGSSGGFMKQPMRVEMPRAAGGGVSATFHNTFTGGAQPSQAAIDDLERRVNDLLEKWALQWGALRA